MKKNKQINDDFHAIEYMRQVRIELTEQYLLDKNKYMDFLEKTMQDFKLRQKASGECHNLMA